MHDPDTFELRLNAALRRYTADDPRTVDAVALARSIATTARVSQPVGLRARLGLGAQPRRPGMLAALFATILLAGAAIVGGQLLAPAPAPVTPPEHGGFSATGSMVVAHGTSGQGTGFSATLLGDGRVLIAGGPGYTSDPVNATETWDPSTGLFRPSGELVQARGDHSATLLADGRVLLAGGWVGGLPTWTAEIWDPESGASAPTGSLSAMRMEHTATLLLDGRVLISGGTENAWEVLPKAEIWDPDTDRFTALGPPVDSLTGRSATRLHDGRVLLIGGYGHQQFEASAETWDPVSETFSATGSMTEPRSGHTAMLLTDGRVLVVGGQGPDDGVVPSAEIWDPKTDQFSPAGPMPATVASSDATLLPDGRVLLVSDTSAVVWDPGTGDMTQAGSLTETRFGPSTTLLADGRVLVVGGYGPQPICGGLCSRSWLDISLTSAEVWTAPSVPSPTPPITADHGSFRLVGPMAAAGRIYHTATLLPDGQVLIVGGGETDDGGPAREELWDPITEAFSDADAMLEPRDEGAIATLLPDGRVLIVGGLSNPDLKMLASAELWDPRTKSFVAAGTMAHGFRTHWAALQPDGRVLVWGLPDPSQDDVTPGLAAEMWDPTTMTFRPASPPLAPPRPGAHLPDGRIMSVPGGSVEIWDPTTGSTSPGGLLIEDRGRTTGPTVTALPDGRVLVVGGHVCRPPDSAKTASLDTAGGCTFEEIDSAEIWDPATGLSNLTGAPMVARAEHTATLLPAGRVLVVGGRGEGNTSAELFELR